jgi:carbon storage regulator CsrA
MLVLSRRLNEKIVFPTINMAVQVLSVKPGLIRLGIEAPPEITVLREELAGRAVPGSKPPDTDRPQAMTALLTDLRRQIEAGETEQARATLKRIEQELNAEPAKDGKGCRCAVLAGR